MKTKFFTLFAAFALLFGAKAMAQTNGDVNEDGKVDEQDITAIVKSVNQANDVVDNSVKNYYWYIGLANPAEMIEIAPIAADNASAGWRYIGTSLPEYCASNMLRDGRNSDGIIFEERDYHYIALPSNAIGIWLGGNSKSDDYDSFKSVVIEGVKYYVYKSKTKFRATGISLH